MHEFAFPHAAPNRPTHPTAPTRLSERGGLRRPGLPEGEEHEPCRLNRTRAPVAGRTAD